MAKRVPKDEKPFKPVEEALVRAVMFGSTAAGQPAAAPVRAPSSDVDDDEQQPVARIVEMPRKQSEAQVAALAAAVAPSPPKQAPPPTRPERVRRSQSAPSADITAGRRDREKRVLLTRGEEHDIERMVARLAGELGTPVKLSHLLRASITMLLHAEGELIDQTKRFPGLTRPGNGNAPEVAEFERSIAQLVAAAFREAPPLR